jgi:hypothetical protein
MYGPYQMGPYVGGGFGGYYGGAFYPGYYGRYNQGYYGFNGPMYGGLDFGPGYGYITPRYGLDYYNSPAFSDFSYFNPGYYRFRADAAYDFYNPRIIGINT